MSRFRYLKDVVTLALDQAACIGCGRCEEVCPHFIFVVDRGKAVITDRDGCMECGACARNCSVDAITVAAGVGCAIGLLNEWLDERKLSKRNCC